MAEPTTARKELKAAWFMSNRNRHGSVRGLEGINTESKAQDLIFAYLENKEAYNRRKARLPAYMVSTTHTFRQRGNAENCAKLHTGLIVVDIDNFQTDAEAEDVREHLQELDGCVTAFLSPSHHGVKGIFKVHPVPTTVAEHEYAWRFVSEYVKGEAGVEIDESGKDVTRLTYCSWDSEAEFWGDSAPIAVPAMPAEPENPAGRVHHSPTDGEPMDALPPVGMANSAYRIPDRMDDQRHLKEWREPKSCWSTMVAAAADFWINWPRWEKYKDIGMFDIAECLTRFAGRTGHDRYIGAEIQRLVEDTAKKFERGVYVDQEKATWTTGTTRQAKGDTGEPHQATQEAPMVLMSSLHDHCGIITEVLEDKTIRLRYNTRANRLEYTYLLGGEWCEITDGFFHRLRGDLRSNYRVMRRDSNKKPYEWPISMSENDLHSALKALGHDRQVDPFEDWLHQEVAKAKWDGTPRLEGLYIDLFGAEDTPLVRWAGKYLFLGIIQRTLDPGCQLDEFTVLIGKQGIGKSQHLRYIFPEACRNDWFSDDFDMSRSDQKRFESTQGFALIEMSEMAGFGAKEIEALKRYITSKVDVQRIPYARVTEHHARRFIFVATTNNETPLPNDPSGNRRFVPIRLAHGANVEAWMNDHRKQLWAEAWHMYHNSTPANLPRELYPLQADAAEGARNVDSIAEELVAKLPHEAMTFTEISEKLRLIQSDMDDGETRLLSFPDTTRIRNALLSAGWSQPTASTRYEGRTGRWWMAPLNRA